MKFVARPDELGVAGAASWVEIATANASSKGLRLFIRPPGRVLLRFPPKLFSVDRIGREDYRIIGESRDGFFVKSFFAGKFGVSLFRSNE